MFKKLLLSCVGVYVLTVGPEAIAYKEPVKGNEIPIVREKKTIFIDTSAKKNGDGSFDKPFNNFESAKVKLANPANDAIVFISGKPPEGFNFKKLRVFGPKASVIVSTSSEEEGESLTVIRARTKNDVQIEKMQALLIKGFNEKIDKVDRTGAASEGVRTAFVENGDSEFKISLTDNSIKILEQNTDLVERQGDKVYIKIPTNAPVRVASSSLGTSSSSLAPIPIPVPVPGAAPIGPIAAPVPAGGPPPVGGGPAPMPAGGPAPMPAGGPAPVGGGPPPMPGGGPAPMPGGGPPPMPGGGPPPLGGGIWAMPPVQMAINSCFNTALKIDIRSAGNAINKIIDQIKRASPGDSKVLVIATFIGLLFENLRTDPAKMNDKNIADKLRFFCNRVNNAVINDVKISIGQARILSNTAIGDMNILFNPVADPNYSCRLHEIFSMKKPGAAAPLPAAPAAVQLIDRAPSDADVTRFIGNELIVVATPILAADELVKQQSAQQRGKEKFLLLLRPIENLLKEESSRRGQLALHPTNDPKWPRPYIDAYLDLLHNIQLLLAKASFIKKTYDEFDQLNKEKIQNDSKKVSQLRKAIIELYNGYLASKGLPAFVDPDPKNIPVPDQQEILALNTPISALYKGYVDALVAVENKILANQAAERTTLEKLARNYFLHPDLIIYNFAAAPGADETEKKINAMKGSLNDEDLMKKIVQNFINNNRMNIEAVINLSPRKGP